MIHTLHKQSKSIREISKIIGFNRQTISKRLRQESLEPYKSYIKKRYEKTLPKQIPSSVILQVDLTILRSGENPLYAFVMVLGFSRAACVYIADNMRQETWQECHLKAFS